MSNNKRKKDNSGDGGVHTHDEYTLLKGSSERSDVDALCLFVPASEADRLLTALQNSKNAVHVWESLERVSKDRVDNLPSGLAFIAVSPLPELLSTELSEEEIYNTLIKGEPAIRKYLVFNVYNHSQQEMTKKGFEMTDEKHDAYRERLHEFIMYCLDCNISHDEGYEVQDVNVWERSQYLADGSGDRELLTQEVLDSFMENSEKYFGKEEADMDLSAAAALQGMFQ